jgi:hypothetical protein
MTRRSRWLAVLALVLAAAAAVGCATATSQTPSAGPGQPASSVTSAPGSPAPSSTFPAATAPAPAPAQPLPRRVLRQGMTGPAVLQLQHRLAALKYYPGPADGRFGPDTLQGVWAFQMVQGLGPTGVVGPATRHALQRPREPEVLAAGGAPLRVEISLARQILVLYRAGHVALISHISSGGGYRYCSPGGGCGYAITPAGEYRTTAFLPGWVTVPLGVMYDPVFFIGTEYAIHGSPDVPLQPASHGCIRIPMDVAGFFHQLVPTPGTPVIIRR